MYVLCDVPACVGGFYDKYRASCVPQKENHIPFSACRCRHIMPSESGVLVEGIDEANGTVTCRGLAWVIDGIRSKYAYPLPGRPNRASSR